MKGTVEHQKLQTDILAPPRVAFATNLRASSYPRHRILHELLIANHIAKSPHSTWKIIPARLRNSENLLQLLSTSERKYLAVDACVGRQVQRKLAESEVLARRSRSLPWSHNKYIKECYRKE